MFCLFTDCIDKPQSVRRPTRPRQTVRFSENVVRYEEPEKTENNDKKEPNTILDTMINTPSL